MRLTDIFVRELVVKPNTLWLMFYRLAIDNRVSELFHDGFVDSIALTQQLAWRARSTLHEKVGTTHEIFNGALCGT